MNQRFASSLAFSGTVIAATLAAALMSSTARAEGPIGDDRPFTSTLSRAQVQAELMKDRRLVSSFASEWNLQQASVPQAPHQITREQARADYIASREQVRAMNAEHGGSGYFAVAPMPAPVTVVADQGAQR
jgi:hypothetical protein